MSEILKPQQILSIESFVMTCKVQEFRASESDELVCTRLAAHRGDAAAQFSQGLAQADAEAVKWYGNAEDEWVAAAQCSLGFCYADGRGVPQDKAEAVRWYRKAGDQGYDNAQYFLGYCCANGEGVQQNHTEAVKMVSQGGG